MHILWLAMAFIKRQRKYKNAECFYCSNIFNQKKMFLLLIFFCDNARVVELQQAWIYDDARLIRFHWRIILIENHEQAMLFVEVVADSTFFYYFRLTHTCPMPITIW